MACISGQRDYGVETIGQLNVKTIRKYIEEQEECSRIESIRSLFEKSDMPQ